MIMGECAVRDQRNPIIDGVCAGCGARMREPLSVSTATGARQAELLRRQREPGEDG